MIRKIYAIKDHATEQHHQPFTAATHTEAQRMLAAPANEPGNLLHNHPRDYSLHFIGEFDTSTGEIIAHEKLCVLPDLVSLKNKPELNEDMFQAQTEPGDNQ